MQKLESRETWAGVGPAMEWSGLIPAAVGTPVWQTLTANVEAKSRDLPSTIYSANVDGSEEKCVLV